MPNRGAKYQIWHLAPVNNTVEALPKGKKEGTRASSCSGAKLGWRIKNRDWEEDSGESWRHWAELLDSSGGRQRPRQAWAGVVSAMQGRRRRGSPAAQAGAAMGIGGGGRSGRAGAEVGAGGGRIHFSTYLGVACAVGRDREECMME